MSSNNRVHRTEGTQPAVINQWGHEESPRRVWVRLDAVLLREPGMPSHINGAGLDMTGEVAGLLTHWVPTVKGDWMGRVNFAIHYADGRPDFEVRDQLVPAYALRPRDDVPK